MEHAVISLEFVFFLCVCVCSRDARFILSCRNALSQSTCSFLRWPSSFLLCKWLLKGSGLAPHRPSQEEMKCSPLPYERYETVSVSVRTAFSPQFWDPELPLSCYFHSLHSETWAVQWHLAAGTWLGKALTSALGLCYFITNVQSNTARNNITVFIYTAGYCGR